MKGPHRGRLILTAFLTLAAGIYATTAIIAIGNFAWPQPAFDQWRLYAIYLTQPFPQNVLQLENGHRPIIPALLRVAEIDWLQANQTLQIGFGAACAVLTAGLLAWIAWREHALPRVLRASGVMFAVLAVLWLGNARMLLHGNELVHAYLLTLSVVMASLCVWRARQTQRLRWVGAASGCCVVATFCFGPGIATFPAMAVLVVALRLPWRNLMILGVGLVICLVLYLFVLPGDDGVRGMLAFRPLDSLVVAARWLSSPWLNSWVGLADPAVQPWVAESAKRHFLGRISLALANALKVIGLHWSGWLSTGIGFAGLAALIVATVRRLRRWPEPQRNEVVALGVCLFAAATGAIIGIGRLGYFDKYPDQIFADRYLVWPCLFWYGLATLGIQFVATRVRERGALALAAIALAAPVLMFAAHRANAGWGAAVYRFNQRSAAAARSNVVDNDVFPNGADASRATVLEVLRLLRERKLAMFAEPGMEWLDRVWSGQIANDTDLAVQMLGVTAMVDARDGNPAAHFEGWVVHGIASVRNGGPLAVLDETDTVRGFAEFSFIAPNARSLRFDVPRKRGFDGYIHSFNPGHAYRLVQLHVDRGEATLLATLPAATATDQ